MNIPLGTIRVKDTGSGGGTMIIIMSITNSLGQNGIADVIKSLGGDRIKFCRIRVGIGKPELVVKRDYVLKQFTEEEKGLVQKTTERVSDCVHLIISKGSQYAMNFFNKSAEEFDREERKKAQLKADKEVLERISKERPKEEDNNEDLNLQETEEDTQYKKLKSS
jgi:hypothetical protein